MSDKIYVLDTSALLTFIEDEEGAESIESLLIEAEKGNVTVYISFISLTEVFYITKRERGEQEALERLWLIKSLALHVLESEEGLGWSLGDVRAERAQLMNKRFHIVGLPERRYCTGNT